MNIRVTSSIDASEILRRRGLGSSDRARRYLAGRFRMRCDPYVPKQQGMLKNTAQILPHGAGVIYKQPYAHYQYYGMVMGPNVLTKKGWRSTLKKGEKKHYTGKPLQYHDGPMRGREWDKRMLADHREDLEKDMSAYLGRRTK